MRIEPVTQGMEQIFQERNESLISYLGRWEKTWNEETNFTQKMMVTHLMIGLNAEIKLVLKDWCDPKLCIETVEEWIKRAQFRVKNERPSRNTNYDERQILSHHLYTSSLD